MAAHARAPQQNPMATYLNVLNVHSSLCPYLKEILCSQDGGVFKTKTESENRKRKHKTKTQSENTKRKHKTKTQNENTKRKHKAKTQNPLLHKNSNLRKITVDQSLDKVNFVNNKFSINVSNRKILTSKRFTKTVVFSVSKIVNKMRLVLLHIFYSYLYMFCSYLYLHILCYSFWVPVRSKYPHSKSYVFKSAYFTFLLISV